MMKFKEEMELATVPQKQITAAENVYQTEYGV